MTYLKQKPGSLEDVIKKQQAPFQESGYQDKFKKELEKAGKGIGSMTPKEKSDFFNKVDDIKKTKSENAPTNADIERLKKQGLKPKKEDAKKVQKKNVDDKRIKEEFFNKLDEGVSWNNIAAKFRENIKNNGITIRVWFY